MPKGDKLTDKQERFVREYFVDLNAKEAAIRAGYSKNSAKEQGYQMLHHPSLAARIDEERKAYYARIGVTHERIAKEYARIAFSDPRGTLTDDGALLNPNEWDEDTAAAISSIEVVTSSYGAKDDQDRAIVEHTHKIKNWDKGRALEAIGKHLGMFTEKHDVNVTGLSITIGDKDADCA